ncbi:hypothetical protein [Aneurinibacillus tyrosinisolvens]|uniref:hypothetical protein n=1 Tax=Aneurinibacillus tyrosinisolvens TaxID=1443435 RepID=UPI00063F0E98|nr:hypothetical protein [Aneurinibacillus tyrosinisolvens]
MNKKIVASALALTLVGGGAFTIAQANAASTPAPNQQVTADNQKDGEVPDAVEKAAPVAAAPKATVQTNAKAAVDDQKDGEVPDAQEKANGTVDDQKDGEVPDAQEKANGTVDDQKDGEVPDSQEKAGK